MLNCLQTEISADHAEARKIVRQLKSLPTLPAQVVKVIQMFTAEDPDTGDIIRVIESDPAISMKILRLVNSPAFGLTAVSSIKKAVVMLGFSEVRSLLLSIVVTESIVKSLRKPGMESMENLWRHSLACGVLAEMIAVRKCPSMAAEAFISGLLHDMGRLIMANCFPETLQLVSENSIEKEVSWLQSEIDMFGVDHGTVGKWLADKWLLPDVFTHSIWLHHHSPDTLQTLDFVDQKDVVLIVQLADQLVHEIMVDAMPGNDIDVSRDDLLKALDITAPELESLSGSLGKSYSERASILDMDEDEGAFYFHALKRANQKLSETIQPGHNDKKSGNADLTPEFLLEMQLELNLLQDIEEIMDHVVETARSVLGNPEGMIYCIDRTRKKLMGRHWLSGRSPASFELVLNESGHPVWRNLPGIVPAMRRLLLQSYKKFGTLSNTAHKENLVQSIDPYLAIPLVGKPFVGALAFKNADDAGSPSLPSGRVSSEEHLGHIIGKTVSSVLLFEKLRMTADSLGTALTQNNQIVAMLKKTNTVKQKMEQELIKSQKLESLGFLAGGIAHDFNNILTAITGNVTLAKLYLKAEEKAFEHLDSAEKAAQRARDLNEQLLNFSKTNPPKKKTVSIRELIKDSINFILRGSNIICDCRIPDPAAMVEVDAGQMNQVFNNLIINAVQSMPNGGTVGVYAENVLVESGHEIPLSKGNYVKITVQDHGTGIAEADIPRIFDPYFSTKENGHGLGLSTTYTIVKNHSGHIKVTSKLNGGTVFHIYLPASGETPTATPDTQGELFPGHGKILVMDDEQAIRDLAGEMLNLLGYEVFFAKDGEVALKSYKRQMLSHHPFDVVLMDLTVPGGMGGRKTIQKLLDMDPGAKVIVTSGYVEDPIMLHFENHGFKGAIAKPYKMLELSKLLHEIHPSPCDPRIV